MGKWFVMLKNVTVFVILVTLVMDIVHTPAMTDQTNLNFNFQSRGNIVEVI